ncbi:MAG: hypothetical protein II411_04555 [Lachnospiraceae bacterium]|nr:hypothetical protein [Lachnospiraceae bacterium]
MKNQICKLVFAIYFVFTLCFYSFSNQNIENYFNEIDPQRHINRMYNKDLKNKLSENVIKYEDIEDLISLYNPEILNLWNNWENNKSSNDVYNDYMNAADNLYDSASGQESAMQEGMLYAQADAMRIQADKNVSDSYTNFLTNYLSEKQLTLSTKILFLNYQKSLYDIQSANLAVEDAIRNEETALNALNYGSGTQIEYLTAKKSTIDAKSNLLLSESSSKTYLRNLIANCGKDSSDSIYVHPILLNDAINANNISLNNDYELALKNSIQYEIYKRKLENARTDEVKREYEVLVNAAPQNLYTDLELKYQNILDALDSNYNALVALSLATDNYEKANNEFSNGNISVKELKKADYNLSIAKLNIQSSKYNLKIAIENYNYVVLGFGNC